MYRSFVCLPVILLSLLQTLFAQPFHLLASPPVNSPNEVKLVNWPMDNGEIFQCVLQKKQTKIITEFTDDARILLFSKPAQQHVQVLVEAFRGGIAELEVLNSAGKPVYQKTIPVREAKNELIVPVPEWPSGMYLVRVTTGQQALTGHFFVDNR